MHEALFLQEIKIQLRGVTENTTNPGEPSQPKWTSRNNVHMRSIQTNLRLYGVTCKGPRLKSRKLPKIVIQSNNSLKENVYLS